MRINALYDWMHMTFYGPLYKFLEHPDHLFQRLKLSLQVVNELEVLYSNQISISKRKLLLFYKQCLQKYLEKIKLVIEE